MTGLDEHAVREPQVLTRHKTVHRAGFPKLVELKNPFRQKVQITSLGNNEFQEAVCGRRDARCCLFTRPDRRKGEGWKRTSA